MDQDLLHVVTGAFGYTGKYIARRLLAKGRRVRTLTRSPGRPNPFRDMVEVAGLDFDNPSGLVESLRGAAALYNTYWVRFPYGRETFATAVDNSKVLMRAAVEAGVRRFIHISVTNPSEESPLGYFRGKAVLERFLIESGLSYAIIRPAVVFGREDILINNIAWLLRKFPVFVVPGNGKYRIQPVCVEDLAELVVDAGERTDDILVDAVGPEIISFNELLRRIAQAVGRRARLLYARPHMAVAVARMIGWFLRDVPLTREEAAGLMADLLVSNQPPTGRTRFTDWLDRNAADLGRVYASELARHYR